MHIEVETPTKSKVSDWTAIAVIIAGLIFVGFQVLKDISQPKSATILTMNDIYRINGIKRGEEGGMARIAAARKMLEARGDVLVLHAGDALSPSLLGNTYKGAQMVDMMNFLDLSEDFDPNLFVTFGNHEFDASKCSSPNALISSVRESNFTWLSGNLDFTKCPSGAGFGEIQTAANVKPYAIVDMAGMKVGIFGLTLNKSRYASLMTDQPAPSGTEAADALDRASYITAAKRHIATLRAEGADYIIGLTHLAKTDDSALLETLGESGPDLIIGGHDHTYMKVGPIKGRFIYKQTADALDVGVHTLTKTADGISHDYEKLYLKADAPKNEAVQQRTDDWLKIHEAGFCAGKKLLTGCLADAMGTTAIDWQLEELKNRESETAIGNWLTETIVTVAAENSAKGPKTFCPAAGTEPIRVGLLGSGSLRLNYDVPKGYALQRREIEELFPFPMEIAAICTTWGAVKSQIEHGLTLKGEGGWPHLSGVKISYSPATTGVSAKILSMTTPDGTTPTDATPMILVANLYVAGQGDGYDWGICNSLPKGTRCADSIEGGSEPNSVVIRSGGKVQDLKKLVLAEFAANSSGTVGPTKFEPKMTMVAP